MSELDEISKAFVSDLERVKALMGLVTSFRDFGSSDVPVEISNGTVQWEEAMALKAAAPGLRTDLPLMSGSMVLYVCGRFEYFVRQVVEAVGDDLASRVAKYDDLPATLREELKKQTFEIAQNHTRYGYSAAEAESLVLAFAANLSGPQPTGGAVSIKSRVLSITDANMHSRLLAEILKRVGVKEPWKDIGKQARLKIYLQTPSDGECTSEAQRRLDELMKERNQIAHPTGGTTFPEPAQVTRSADFLGALASVLVDVCQVYLAGTAPSTLNPGP
jgi:hypothetical protein